MDLLSEYFKEELIVKLLCGYRAKHCHRRHKLHMMRDISLHDSTKKIKIDNSNKEFEILRDIFPSRRNWVKLNQFERKKFDNSIVRAREMLYKSYLCYKRKNFPIQHCEIWYQNLIKLVNSVKEKLEALDNYTMESPQIIGILKKIDKNKTEYRPIAIYELEDRIISSLSARYLTDFFDQYFYDCSYAFRSSKNQERYTHHKSVAKILDYRKEKEVVYVAECDIQKFFDTVNHEHIRKVFYQHIEFVKLRHDKIIDKKIVTIFDKFLNSFAFNKDVFPKNTDKSFWINNRLKENGYFKWIEKVLSDDYGVEYLNNRIGVPQGNAISCFISNLLLHNVDSKVREVCSEIFYVRFCDDMILMHEDVDKCLNGLEVYKNELKNNYLFFHPPAACDNYLTKENRKKFWRESKSKQPYLWANPQEKVLAFPWLSFVGYQIKYDLNIRLRRDAVRKEKRKQVKEVQNVLKAIGTKQGNLNETSRKSKRQIIFSLQNRLNSMSVGRIKLHNYKAGKQGLCWTNGFEMIKGKRNKNISRQLKDLDSFREKQIWRLKQNLKTLNKKSEKPDEMKQDIYFGSPYSYHNYLNDFKTPDATIKT